MNSKFFNALTSKDLFGENFMPTHSTSGSAIVDMFFKMGAGRETPPKQLVQLFVNALAEDRELAIKAIFYNRDVRGGQGERLTFRVFFRYLCQNYPDIAAINIPNVVLYGRWDDLLVGLATPIEDEIIDFILYHLKEGDKLCAKWMPRENKSLGEVAKYIMNKLEMSPKTYRKLLAGNTQVVENLMCKNEWDKIDYNKLPSIAINKYRKAWYRHDAERFTSWVESLTKPESKSKIHADAIFPHTIVSGMARNQNKTEQSMLQAQWDALPNYMPKGYNILPICDVSGSMYGLPLEVCVSLGIYLSERNVGQFKDMFITFSEEPKLQLLSSKSLYEKIIQLQRAHWDMNTDLEAVFRLILNKANEHHLTEEDMPKVLLILSDMQFDECAVNADHTAMEMMSHMYKEAGYNLPQIVFWNLRDSIGIPVKFNENGVCLVSGFSPSIMKNILGGEMNPIAIVKKTLMSDRYNPVKF